MSDATPPKSGSQSSRIPWSSLRSLLNEFAAALGRLLERGNRRELILRTADNRTFLRLPTTLAVLFGLLLLWQAALLFVVSVLVALVLKVQFIIASDVSRADGGTPREGATPPAGR